MSQSSAPDRSRRGRDVAASVVIGTLIALLGAVIHFSDLGTIPGLIGDEAYYGVLALLDDPSKEIAWSDRGTWFPTLIRGAIRVFGTSPEAVRFFPALFATLLPVVAFFAQARSLGLLPVVTLSVLLLAHPALLVFGRIGCDYSLLPFIVGLLMLGSEALHRNPTSFLPLTIGSLLAGLALTLHPTGFLPAGAWIVCVVANLVRVARDRTEFAIARGPALILGRLAAGAGAFLAGCAPALPFLIPFVLRGGENAAVLASRQSPADLIGLVSGGLAIQWVTGLAPFHGLLGWALAACSLAIALTGIALGLLARGRPERASAIFCAATLALGFAALARTDLRPPGNVRYALTLFPCVVWGMGRAPDLISSADAGALRRRLGRAAPALVLLIAAAGLWGWYHSFWAPLRAEARAYTPAFSPGRDRDPKEAMVAKIRERQEEAGQPSAALVAANWDLYQAARYLSRRRYAVLRIDSHSVEDFTPRFRDLFLAHERLYLLFFERPDNGEERLVPYLESLIGEPVAIEKEIITDRAGRSVIAVYRFDRRAASRAPAH